MANQSGIRAGRAFVEFFSKDAPLRASLKRLQADFQSWGKSIQKVGAIVFAAGGTVATTAMGMVTHFSNVGDAVAKMARRTGLSTEAVSELGFAAEQSGASLEDVENGVRKMQKSLADGADVWDRLGISVSEFRKMSPEDQLEKVADKLARVKNPAEKAGIALEIFGKSGTKLIPLLSEGAKGIQALREEAQALGLSIGGETAEKAEILNDAFGRMWRTVKAVSFAIGESLAPTITEVLGVATKFVVGVINWTKSNKDLVVTVFKIAAGVAAAGGAILAFGVAVSSVGYVIGTLSAAIGAIGSVLGFVLSPLGVVTAALVGLGVVLWKTGTISDTVIPWLKQNFGDLFAAVSDVMGGIVEALRQGDFGAAANVAWLGLRVVWMKGTNWVRNQWDLLWFNIEETLSANNIAKMIVNLWAKIRSAWVSGGDAVLDWHDSFTTSLARGFVEIERRLGLISDEQAAQMQEAFNQQDVADREKKNQRAEARGRALTDIERERAAQIDAIDKGMTPQEKIAQQRRIGDLLTNAQTRAQGVEDIQKELRDALAEIDRKRNEAKNPNLSKKLGQGSEFEFAKTSVSSVGSFSAAALSAAGGAGTIQTKQLAQLELIARATRAMQEQGRGIGFI